MIGMRKQIDFSAALVALTPKAMWSIRDNDYEKIEWFSEDLEKPSKAALEAKVQELLLNEPYAVLREIRDWYLKESDWTQSADIRAIRGAEWCAAWDSYRQELRDLTTTFTPYFEGDSPNIMGVTFPEKPSA
tara:strand:- start:4134 stop:4529 length:396 start_codon:yes stop_codon:yes gene_type:complete